MTEAATSEPPQRVGEGGFVALLVGGLLFAAMATWSHGRSIHRAHLADRAKPVRI